MPISARTSVADRIVPLHAAAQAVGRDPASIAISVFGATTDVGGLEQLAAEGVTRAVLTLPYEDADVVLPILDEWASLTERFLP